MKKKFIVIGVVLLVVCMLITGIICLIIRGKHNKQFNAFMRDISKDEIIEDGHGMAYVDAQLLLTAAEEITYKEIENLVDSYGGEIVGFIELSNDYQLLFKGLSGRNELNELANQLNSEPIVELCGLHRVITVSPETVIRPDDPWLDTSADANNQQGDGDWDLEIPSGNNWWIEIMQLNSLWMLTDGHIEPIKVGIIDSNFDLNHRDVHYTKTYEIPTDENGNISNSNSDHGTYVAGIIGATHDNNRCISGIAPNARLYCDSTGGDHDYYDLPLFRFNYIISQMLCDGVKIINMSWGYTELSASAYYDAIHNVAVEDSSALTDIKYLADNVGLFLSRALKKYDFLITKAAGNQANERFSLSSADTENTHKYSLYVDRTGGTIMLPDMTADYDFMGAISDDVVKEHIIMVGSLDAECSRIYSSTTNSYYSSALGDYSKSDFSLGGCDIYAPGGKLTVTTITPGLFGFTHDETRNFEVLSLAPCSTTSPEGGTDAGMGTSAAAPMVAGVAALLWGYSPELSAVDIRDSLINCGNIGLFFVVPDGIKAVNPIASFRMLKSYQENEGSEPPELSEKDKGIVMGYAYILEDGKNNDDPTDDVYTIPDDTVIEFFNENNELLYTAELYDDNSFVLLALPQEYFVRAYSELYDKSWIGYLRVNKDEVNFVRLQLTDRCITEYSFAVQETIRKGSWEQYVQLGISLDAWYGEFSLGGDFIAEIDYFAVNYDPYNLGNSDIVGYGYINVADIIEEYLEMYYGYGLTEYETSLFGEPYYFSESGLPLLFDFDFITSEKIEKAEINDDVITFEINPDRYDKQNFYVFSELSDIADMFFDRAYVSVELNDDRSINSIQVLMFGTLDFYGADLDATYSLLYTFSEFIPE